MKTISQKKMNKYQILVAIAAMAGLMSCSKSNSDYDAAGNFEATEITVSSEASGKLLVFNVEEGQTLQAGEEVGAIDSVQLYLRKQQLIATEKAIQVRRPDVKKQIAALQEQLASAKTEQNRVKNLLKANAATQKQMDDVNAQVAVLEKQLDAQKTTLLNTDEGMNEDTQGLKIQMEQIQDQLNKCHVISPITGTVLVKYAEQGELTMPGKALFKIADTNNMILRAYVTNGQLSTIKIGQKVKVYADAGDGKMKEYDGTLAWVSSQSEFTPKTIETKDERANLVYAVKIDVKNDGFLKIGMYGNVKF